MTTKTSERVHLHGLEDPSFGPIPGFDPIGGYTCTQGNLIIRIPVYKICRYPGGYYARACDVCCAQTRFRNPEKMRPLWLIADLP